jgi:uncharacterized membrane protein
VFTSSCETFELILFGLASLSQDLRQYADLQQNIGRILLIRGIVSLTEGKVKDLSKCTLDNVTAIALFAKI